MKARAVDGTEAKAAAAAVTIVPTVDGRHLFMIGRHSRCEIESREGSGCWVGGSIEEDVQRFDLRTRLASSLVGSNDAWNAGRWKAGNGHQIDGSDRQMDRPFILCVRVIPKTSIVLLGSSGARPCLPWAVTPQPAL